MIDHRADLAGDNAYVFTDGRNQPIARIAWLPQKPGAAILASVVPFIAIALAGFALLAGLVLRYMRTTAATIVAGENRLRYLALHDPLCGLPNRNFFSERLETVIAEVKRGGAPMAVFYIDLDHFKDVNDTLGHSIGDELIRSVTQRLSHTHARRRSGRAPRRRRVRRHHDRVGRSCRAARDRAAHDLHAVRALLDQRQHHRHRRQHRHRRHRPARRRHRPTSCATPTWRSTAPRTKAATAPASTTR